MGTTTPGEIARHARELADELERGEGPRLEAGALHREGVPCCAMGHLLARAGADLSDAGMFGYNLMAEMLGVWSTSRVPCRAIDAVADANDGTRPELRSRAVVAPLRALADALDAMEAARRASTISKPRPAPRTARTICRCRLLLSRGTATCTNCSRSTRRPPTPCSASLAPLIGASPRRPTLTLTPRSASTPRRARRFSRQCACDWSSRDRDRATLPPPHAVERPLRGPGRAARPRRRDRAR